MATNERDMPKIYLDAVNAGDPEKLSKLFAPNAIFLGPDGRKHVGRQAIRELYTAVFRQGKPNMEPGRIIMEGNRIAFELISRSQPPNPDDPATAVDLIEIDDQGLISRFVVFIRPTVRPA